MYTTVKAIHIALDNAINQVNSNRKQSFFPEEYDMAINEAVREEVNALLSPYTNIKQEGVEDTKPKYDRLRELKREVELKPFKDNGKDRVFTFLPANYKTILSSESNVRYRRNHIPSYISDSLIVEEYSFLKLWGQAVNNLNVVITNSEDGRVDNYTFDFTGEQARIKTPDGRFTLVNRVIDVLRRAGLDAYYERFDGIYRPQSILLLKNNYKSLSFNSWTPTVINMGTYKRAEVITDVVSKRVENDLIATEDVRGLLDNYHSQKNRHLNPISEIVDDRLYVYHNFDFYVDEIYLSYYKEPSLCDYRSNTLPDIDITDTMLARAARILLGSVKDSFGYQTQAAKANSN